MDLVLLTLPLLPSLYSFSMYTEDRNYYKSNKKIMNHQQGMEHEVNAAFGPAIHTFESEHSCQLRCITTCAMHHLPDLNMPRWICPTENKEQIYNGENYGQYESSYIATNTSVFTNQTLILFIPLLVVILIILIIIVLRKSTHST
uniref:Protein with signal anchor n=1 Tax=Parastrongyloides trichosuri TaxID=131310 RepID=A0A0N4Z5B4_PARTI